MMHRTLLVVLVSLGSTVIANADARPAEALLAKDCLAYLRFDGMAAHQAAYEKTVLSELLNRDLGQLLSHLGELIQDEAGPSVVKTKLQAGLPPEQLLQFHHYSARLPQVFQYLKQHGFVVGLEYVSLLPPQGQLTIVFPNGGQTGHKDSIYAGCQLLAALNDLKVAVSRQADRDVHETKLNEMLHWRWWQEGEHVMMTIGNAGVEHTVSVLEGKRPNLASNPLLAATEKAAGYETVIRGFVDTERALAFAKLLPKESSQAIDELGLKELKSATFHVGYEGKKLRSSLVLNLAGERKGLLKLLSGDAGFGLEPLPPLPPDAASVVTLHVESANLYAFVKQLENLGPKPTGDKPAESWLTKLNHTTGIDVEKDLLPALGSKVVVYNSGGEGIFGTGFGLAIQVKDEKKLGESLTAIMRSLPSAFESDVQITKRSYLGVEMHTARLGGRGGPNLSISPTYTIHNGWLVVGTFPQTVQGYLLRTQQKVSTWKPSPMVTEEIARIKRNPRARLLLVNEADPRTPVRDLAGFAPFFLTQLSAFGQSNLDPTIIPNFQAMTENLFPNLGVIYDDGNAIRLETHQSLGIPFDPVGVQTYWLGVFLLGQFGF